MKKYEEKEYLDAQFLFEKSLQNNPMNTNFKIPYYIGMCRFNVGDYVRSVDDYDKAYKFRPDVSDPDFENWLNLLVWRGKALQQCGYLDQACEDWTEAKELNSIEAMDFLSNYCIDYRPNKKISAGNLMTLIEQGISAYNLGDFTGTIQILDEAIEIDTTTQNVLLFTYRATAKHKLKDYTGAISDFTKALNLKPINEEELKSWRDSFYNRGVSKYFLKDREGACQDWQAAFNQGVKESKFLLNSYCEGKILLRDEKTEGFLQNYQKPDEYNIDLKSTENTGETPVIDDKKKLSTFLSEIDAISKTFNSTTSPSISPVAEANSTQSAALTQVNNSYYIIIGAFKVLENAERLSKEVKSKGYNPEIIQKADKGFWVLSIASFNNQEAALSKLKEVKLEFPAAYLFGY
jgi:tetratricopeptide (TPR) repeat protein